MDFKLYELEAFEDSINREIKNIKENDEYLGSRFTIHDLEGVEVQIIVTARGEDFLMPEDEDDRVGLIGVEPIQ